MGSADPQCSSGSVNPLWLYSPRNTNNDISVDSEQSNPHICFLPVPSAAVRSGEDAMSELDTQVSDTGEADNNDDTHGPKTGPGNRIRFLHRTLRRFIHTRNYGDCTGTDVQIRDSTKHMYQANFEESLSDACGSLQETARDPRPPTQNCLTQF